MHRPRFDASGDPPDGDETPLTLPVFPPQQGHALVGRSIVRSPIENGESKRLGLLHAAVPAALVIGVLMNPDNASFEVQSGDLSKAARALGLKRDIAQARNEADFEPAVAGLVPKGAGPSSSRPMPSSPIALSRWRRSPAVIASRQFMHDRDFAAAGGLISYGTSRAATYRQSGIYIGRILHGEKPGDLPVMLPTHYELVINIKTAKALGIEVPPTLSATADEIIE